MLDHILSQSEIQYLKSDVNQFKIAVEETRDSLERIITNFEKNEVVQSFYLSGNFGSNTQNRLKEIMDGLNEYYQTLCSDGELCDQTKQFLDDQESRVNSGN